MYQDTFYVRRNGLSSVFSFWFASVCDTKNTTWENTRNAPMRCQLSGGRRRLAYKAAAIHMCIHSIITTISCIIIRQIQVQRFFFSEGQVMKKSILRKYFLS